MDAVEHLKKMIGFRETALTCMNCKYREVDPTFDEFSKGDQCGRNQDFKFKVIEGNSCDMIMVQK